MQINNYEIEIISKKVKNINLRVYPNLSIKASVPENMNIESVKRMISSKEDWIRKQLTKYKEQNRITKRNYVSGEDHYLNGKRYVLRVYDSNKPSVKIVNGKKINMYVRKSSSVENKEKLMLNFYKEQLTNKLKTFIPKWENIIGVKIKNYTIRKMKNTWGSCNINKKTIIFNSELAKKNNNEIQLVVVHELLHLIEKNHNDNFKMLMTKFYPNWNKYQESLNELI